MLALRRDYADCQSEALLQSCSFTNVVVVVQALRSGAADNELKKCAELL